MRRTSMLQSFGPRRWLPVAAGFVFLVLLAILFVTFQPDTAPSASTVVERSSDRPSAAPGPAPTALPAGDPTEPSALRGEAFPFACPIRDVADGALGFVRLEAYGPYARKLAVVRGELTGESDVVEGEGDLVRDGQSLARVRWREAEDGAVVCEAGPVPQAEVTGVVVDVRGVPTAEASVIGCGGRVVSDAEGRFVLVVPEGRACRVRAQQLGKAPGASPAIDVVPPAEVTLEIERRTVDDIRAEIGREVTVLGALDRVEQHRTEALGQPVAEGELPPEVAARRERIRRLEAALASEDPDAVLQEWLGE